MNALATARQSAHDSKPRTSNRLTQLGPACDGCGSTRHSAAAARNLPRASANGMLRQHMAASKRRPSRITARSARLLNRRGFPVGRSQI